MTDDASGPTRGGPAPALCPIRASKVIGCECGSPTEIREHVPALLDERTASAETSSYTLALASESSRQKSNSLALERQLSGVMMTPANWHAQWIGAASQRFFTRVARWGARGG